MSQPKIHFVTPHAHLHETDAGGVGFVIVPELICQQYGDRLQGTTDASRVTCKGFFAYPPAGALICYYFDYAVARI
jgi:hypothetical protein